MSMLRLLWCGFVEVCRALKTPQGMFTLLGMLLCLAFGVLYYWLSAWDLIGFTRDDAIYVVSSEALAKGDGFTLRHLAAMPAQVKYPIGYPLLLMPVWWIIPEFPQNQWLLALVTVVISTLGLALSFFYLLRVKKAPAWLAMLITALTACNFYWIYFASSLMAEGMYFFFSFLALIVLASKLEGVTPEQKISAKSLALCIAVSVIPFHVRQLGLSIVFAATIYLLLKKRFKTAAIYFVICLGVTILPWMVWTTTQYAPTPTTFETILSYAPYMSEFVTNFSESVYLQRLIETLGSFVYRLQEGMFNVIPNLFHAFSLQSLEKNPLIAWAHLIVSTLSAYCLLAFFILRLVTGVRECLRQPVDNDSFRFFRKFSGVSVSLWYLFVYLAVCIVWAYEDQMSRFLPMVFPLFWWYLFEPCIRSITGKKKVGRNVALILLLAALSLAPAYKTFHNLKFFRDNFWVETAGHPIWEDYLETINYIRAFLPEDAVIAATHEGVIYLYSGRKTYHLNPYAFQLKAKSEGFDRTMLDRMKHMRGLGVQYLLVEPSMKNRILVADESPLERLTVEAFLPQMRLLLVSKHRYVKLYRILPEEN
ncbi:MAG: hypothetical protein VKJ04_09200 [Vampirovibrionales bacterium]|nr:hypothetical protein [Vampirovibrionales bacterium]